MFKLFILLSIFTASLYASIGSITKSLGDVYIIRDMKSQKVKVGDKVLIKDLLFSRSKSKVQVTFIDQTIISIGQKSTFLIEDYVYDEKDRTNSRCSFKFSKGSFKSVSGQIGKIAKENFKLKTKNANISIKGTVNMANQFVNENGDWITTTVTTQGATFVSGLTGEGQLVGAGMANNVLGNQAAFGAFKAPFQLLEAFNLATDPTTSQTPNLSKLSSQNNSQSSNSIKGNGQTSNKQQKSSSNALNDLNNTSLSSSANNSLESSGVSNDLDNENSWGAWSDVNPLSGKDVEDRVDAGENNLETVVQGLINDASTTTLNFEGQVSGSISNSDSILNNVNNVFLMTLQLGGGTDNFNASISFEDSSSNLWAIDYTGSATSTSFTGTLDAFGANVIVPTVGPNTAITGGNVSGNYSGTSSVTGVDGTWDATTGAITATGTFQADVQ